MQGENIILSKILDMQEEFHSLKEEYLEKELVINKEDYIDKISFMEDKLDILNIAILDDIARKECQSLKKDIDSFKKDTDIEEYEFKLHLIKALNDLMEIVDSLKPIEVLYIVEMMFGFVKLTSRDMEGMTKDKLIYLNILKDKSTYSAELEELSRDERFNHGKELLEELVNFTLESYNKNDKPFDLYEKIMIINILDTIKFYLRYK